LPPGAATTLVLFVIAAVLIGLSSGLLDIISNARASEAEAHLKRPMMIAPLGTMACLVGPLSAIRVRLGRVAAIRL